MAAAIRTQYFVVTRDLAFSIIRLSCHIDHAHMSAEEHDFADHDQTPLYVFRQVGSWIAGLFYCASEMLISFSDFYYNGPLFHAQCTMQTMFFFFVLSILYFFYKKYDIYHIFVRNRYDNAPGPVIPAFWSARAVGRAVRRTGPLRTQAGSGSRCRRTA